ncbi:hypothetical protein SDC9_94420 [bioreactor metagenome]|uniref:Uncharacterized protein n=1 Tax=bioreactor metagenome TaxID=1076179 RepID=A0A645A454_9ZZZZ
MVAAAGGKTEELVQPSVNIAVIQRFLKITGGWLISSRVTLPDAVVNIVVVVVDGGDYGTLYRVPDALCDNHQPKILGYAAEDERQSESNGNDQRKRGASFAC